MEGIWKAVVVLALGLGFPEGATALPFNATLSLQIGDATPVSFSGSGDTAVDASGNFALPPSHRRTR